MAKHIQYPTLPPYVFTPKNGVEHTHILQEMGEHFWARISTEPINGVPTVRFAFGEPPIPMAIVIAIQFLGRPSSTQWRWGISVEPKSVQRKLLNAPYKYGAETLRSALKAELHRIAQCGVIPGSTIAFVMLRHRDGWKIDIYLEPEKRLEEYRHAVIERNALNAAEWCKRENSRLHHEWVIARAQARADMTPLTRMWADIRELWRPETPPKFEVDEPPQNILLPVPPPINEAKNWWQKSAMKFLSGALKVNFIPILEHAARRVEEIPELARQLREAGIARSTRDAVTFIGTSPDELARQAQKAGLATVLFVPQDE